jgi:hypothetical protein
VANSTFPFVARGVPGEVRITYSVNENPDRWGFDILGLEGDVSRAAAFPVFEASVSYEREGYASIFGWIQVVHYWAANAEAPEWSLLDAPPQLRGLGAPFLTWGLEPRCFDAPLDTPDGISRWQAVTFLTQTPDGLLTRIVEPLVGMTWGYSVADGKPTISPLSAARQQDWDGVRVTLEQNCPLWTFGDELPLPS